MKNKLIKTVFAMIIAAAMLVSAMPSVASAGTSALLSVDTGSSEILPTGKTFYIPSGISPSAVKLNTSAGTLSYKCGNGANVSLVSGGEADITAGKTTDSDGSECYSVRFIISGRTYDFVFYFTGNIPTVCLFTSAGIDAVNANKNYRDTGVCAVICDSAGNCVYSDAEKGTFSELKGRGNATWSYRKKPYQLKLDSKTDLFGMGKAKTWILLANYIDSSYIKNSIAYELAGSLGLLYTPQSVFVNLYIDGAYTGLYQLCEKTQIGKNRVDIADLEDTTAEQNKDIDLDSLPTKTVTGDMLTAITNIRSYSYVTGISDPDDITGGYLIELDNLYSGPEKSKFTTDIGNTYVIKSPECASEEQVKYIAELFSDFEEALYSSDGYNSLGRHYSEYCDIESLAKVYTVEEATKNWDAYIGSMFFYKDADQNGVVSKLYAGPVWDFDNTWGNLTRGTFASDKTELWADGDNNYGGSTYKSDFGKSLTSHPEAMMLVADYYNSAAETLEAMLANGGYIDGLRDMILPSVVCDRSLYGYTGRQSAFMVFQVYSDGADTTENTALGYLRSFIGLRTAALKVTLGKYLLPDSYHKVSTDSWIISNSKYFKAGSRATVISPVETDLSVMDESGNAVAVISTGGEVYSFIMPDCDVYVKSDTVETTTETTVETTTSITVEKVTETSSVLPEDTSDTETTVPSGQKDKANTVTIAAIIAVTILAVSAIVVLFFVKKSRIR